MDKKDTSYLIAEYVRTMTYDSLPETSVAAAKFMLKDALALSIAGSNAVIYKRIHRIIVGWGGLEEASVLVCGNRLPVHHAAFLNSLLIHSLDFDDTHDLGTLHVSPAAVPACLAVGQLTSASGKELLAAIVNSVEIAVKLATSITEAISATGWIYSAICQYLSTAAVSAAMMGLDDDGIVMALGNAYAQMGGTYQVSADAADTKRFQPALAVRDGVFSAVLAAAGVTGCRNVIDGKYGFVNQYLRGKFDASHFSSALKENGQKEIEQLSYKPYPSCRFTHSGIDAAKKLVREYDLRAEDILSGEILVSTPTFRSVCNPVDLKQAPQTLMQAQYSLPFTVAMTIVKGSVDLKTMTSAMLADEQIVSLSKKLVPVISGELDERYGRSVAPCILKLNTSKGNIELSVAEPLGSPQNPFTQEIIERKLFDCIEYSGRDICPSKVNELLRMVDHLENVKNVSDFVERINEICNP